MTSSLPASIACLQAEAVPCSYDDLADRALRLFAEIDCNRRSVSTEEARLASRKRELAEGIEELEELLRATFRACPGLRDGIKGLQQDMAKLFNIHVTLPL